MGSHTKALSEAQKQERRQAILDAALNLFQSSSYEQVSMANIARAAKIAKGTVYIYFKTKEELFLALIQILAERFFDEIDAGLNRISSMAPGSRSNELIAHFDNTLHEHVDMMRLRPLVHTVLENNVDYESALAFKRFSQKRILTTGALMEYCFPMLEPGQGATLFFQVDAIIIGLRQLSETAPIVKEIIEKENLRLFEIDFRGNFKSLLGSILSSIGSAN